MWKHVQFGLLTIAVVWTPTPALCQSLTLITDFIPEGNNQLSVDFLAESNSVALVLSRLNGPCRKICTGDADCGGDTCQRDLCSESLIAGSCNGFFDHADVNRCRSSGHIDIELDGMRLIEVVTEIIVVEQLFDQEPMNWLRSWTLHDDIEGTLEIGIDRAPLLGGSDPIPEWDAVAFASVQLPVIDGTLYRLELDWIVGEYEAGCASFAQVTLGVQGLLDECAR